MKTNREEILQSALRLFMSMNYERVSLQMVTEAVGLTKTGIFNYYASKQELFVAVADRYLFNAQDPEKKYAVCDGTLSDFIDKYIRGVAQTREYIVRIGRVEGDAVTGKHINSAYINLFQQVLFYYPGGKQRLHELMKKEYCCWREAVRGAILSGEVREDVDPEEAAALFRQVFVGMSYEMSFFNGLEINVLERRFRYIYDLLKR